MATTMHRQRHATPERWQKALDRAIAGKVQVRQLAGSGAWVATSASDPSTAYELSVFGNVVTECTCPAAEHGDPVCCHRAAFWHLVGALTLPAPEPVTQTVRCQDCLGDGFVRISTGGRFSDWWPGRCLRCDGTGEVAVTLEVLAA